MSFNASKGGTMSTQLNVDVIAAEDVQSMDSYKGIGIHANKNSESHAFHTAEAAAASEWCVPRHLRRNPCCMWKSHDTRHDISEKVCQRGRQGAAVPQRRGPLNQHLAQQYRTAETGRQHSVLAKIS